MATPQRQSRPGTSFVTSATWNRRRLFQATGNAEFFLETLQHYRRECHYKLDAFVAMPDHIHLLITPQNVTLERAMMLIKAASHIGSPATIPYGRRDSRTTVSATARIS